MAGSIESHFSELPDPRVPRGQRHSLSALLTIAICAVICGADSWTEVEQFGRAKKRWFQTFLDLPHGIASHDTFGRVFAALNPEAFDRCFRSWTKALAAHTGGKLIAIDGKTLRRSFAHAWDKSAIHMVSAYACTNNLVFGQLATEAKSNEITAIPKLLELLDLTGSVVTIDAMGCQKEIARTIIQGGGDYLLALKDNQPTLHRKVRGLLDEAILEGFVGMTHDRFEETDAGHGRIETRRVWCTPEVHWIKQHKDWPGLRSVVVIESIRRVGTEESSERRYYISSLDGSDAARVAALVRGHWGIENRLHWTLDMAFREDDCRVRTGHAAENFSRLRRIALNLLKCEKTLRVGLKAKRLRAGWDHDYLLAVLQV